jgi:hypothetical protein
VQEAVLNPTDTTVLARLGDDLDEFSTLISEVSVLHLAFCFQNGLHNALECTYI